MSGQHPNLGVGVASSLVRLTGASLCFGNNSMLSSSSRRKHDFPELNVTVFYRPKRI